MSSDTVIWAYRNAEEEGRILGRWKGFSFDSNALVVIPTGQIWVCDGQICYREDTSRKCISSERVIIFAHGGRDSVTGSDKLIEKLNIVDYSSSDEPYYSEMLSEVEKAATSEELIRVALHWVEFFLFHYQVDILRRIKHRAMNLFAPLDTDCQYLLELWERRDYDAARRHLEDLQRDWQGEPPFSNSPLSKLARLWYMLVGNNMNWPHFVKLGDVNICHPFGGVSVESPEKVVSLPANKCLYDWLDKVGRANSIGKVVEKAGLKEDPSKQKFEPDTNAGIYRFAVALQKRLIHSSLPDLRPDTPMQGFKHCKTVKDCETVEENFKAFRKWLRCLNEAFEKLGEELGGQITVQDVGQ